MIFDPDIIRSFAEKYITDIRQSMDSSGVTASGNFNRSLTYTQTDKELIIEGAAYAGAIEFGRKPSSGGGGSGVLKELIRKWIDDKGITPTGNISKDSLAYLIARKIHQQGTAIFSGTDHYGRSKPSKVIDGIRTDGRIEKLGKDLALNIITEIKTQIIDNNATSSNS
jgi:hypothetical protein